LLSPSLAPDHRQPPSADELRNTMDLLPGGKSGDKIGQAAETPKKSSA
jgi:hypothetical protein